MGYMRHHAIVVTSFDSKKINVARNVATLKIGLRVTDAVEGVVNGYYTFLIVPDGSKESWDDSAQGDTRRAEFKAWLREQEFKDGSSVLQWVEVFFGDDARKVGIEDDGDAKRRSPSENER